MRSPSAKVTQCKAGCRCGALGGRKERTVCRCPPRIQRCGLKLGGSVWSVSDAANPRWLEIRSFRWRIGGSQPASVWSIVSPVTGWPWLPIGRNELSTILPSFPVIWHAHDSLLHRYSAGTRGATKRETLDARSSPAQGLNQMGTRR